MNLFQFRPGYQQATKMKCQQCGHLLHTGRTCRSVFLGCQGCGARFNLQDYADELDDDLQEILAMLPCDRF